jgi:hypothetical protein
MPNGKEDRPTMDGSKQQPKVTAGLDIGDRYSYLCLIDQESGQVIEEGRLRTTPQGSEAAFRFSRAASYAHRNRGGYSLAVGEQGA